MDTAETATKLVEFSKSPCMGKCPSYNLVLKTDGTMEYIGKRHVERMGVYTKNLDETTYKAIYTALKKENMYQYDDVYNGDIMDGSKTRVIYYGDQGKKAFGTVFDFPGNMKDIAAALEAIAVNEEGWEAADVPTEVNEVTKEDEPTYKVVTYSQGACFGQCPVFSIDIFSDKRMIYTGKSNSKKQGIYSNTLSQKDYDTLLSLLNSSALQEVDTKDDENIMDAQQFKVKYVDGKKKQKEVKWKINDAKVLQDLKGFFQNQSKSRGWEKKTPGNSSTPDDFSNTVIISLSPKVQAKDWVLTKRHLDAKIVKFLSPNGTYFLLQVNPELNIHRVKEELRRDRNVLQVQDSNRPATPRGNSPEAGKSGKKGSATIRGNGK